ncbi:MAG: ABC transporter permease [Caldilineaceae bacterium]|nr:ABC transporter permease [Caldilineaceae bacterium]
MAFGKLFTIAFRDLGRNRRRTLFTMIAVAMGLALTVIMSGLIADVYDQALEDNIRLETGHLQLRAESYESDKVSLKWEDLIDNPDEIAAVVDGMEEVVTAAPVLWGSAIVDTADESASLKLFGIETASPFHDPIREAIVAGSFLDDADRNGILLGQRLVDELGLSLNQQISVSAVDSNGEPQEDLFTIRGIFSTGIPAYDQSTLFMTLDKAQALTLTDGHASAIVVMLHDQHDADRVAAALSGSGLKRLTWRDLNSTLIDLLSTGQVIYNIMYAIVLLIVAVVLANTLLMAVFERIREMGILAALGMKRNQIMLMYVLEAFIIGLFGVAIGLALGGVGVAYLARNGIYIGDVGASVEGMALGTSMHATFDAGMTFWLSVATLGFTLIASLYPAWFAGRMEPAEALRG